MRTAPLALFVVALAGCGFEARALLETWDGSAIGDVAVLDLTAEGDAPVMDGGTWIGELGPSNIGAGEFAGATFDFAGTGGRVCVIVDPQSVFRDDLQRGGDGNEYPNPNFEDFPHDDGDLDMQIGLASFYTGTPGESMGDFFASFPDDNGIDRSVDLNECLMEDRWGVIGGHAGRSTPEWCDFETQVGNTYRVALTVFSVPKDDNELKYAVEIFDGPCPASVDECTLRGDVDYDEETAALFPGDDVYTVEDMYCDALP
jgi:hypothetical protein